MLWRFQSSTVIKILCKQGFFFFLVINYIVFLFKDIFTHLMSMFFMFFLFFLLMINYLFVNVGCLNFFYNIYDGEIST